VRRLRQRGTCARRSSACVPKVRGRWERPTSRAYGWRESWSRPDSYECVTRAVRLAVCEPSTLHRLVQLHTLFLIQTFQNRSYSSNRKVVSSKVWFSTIIMSLSKTLNHRFFFGDCPCTINVLEVALDKQVSV